MYICFMDIRQDMIDTFEGESKEYIIKFWEAYDKLFEEMDNLTYEEYKVRNKEMWNLKSEAEALNTKGSFFLLTLGGLENKASKLYGDKSEVMTFPIPPPTKIVNLKTQP